MPELTVRALAEAVGCAVLGRGDTVVTGAASVRDAEAGDVVLAENARYLAEAERSAASAIVCAEGAHPAKPAIVSANPRRTFAEILEILAPAAARPASGVDPSCRIGERLSLGDEACVGWGCWIGDDVVIGDGAVIHPMVYVGDGVRIGVGSVLHPHVVIYGGCEIGSRVTIHAGSVIGADGFGYIQVGGELRKVPQIGNVVIEDDVEIGACATVDRAKTGSTRIGAGTKIDNQVQIAHNCRTGRMCILAGQTAMGGSSSLGDGVIVGGQSGIRDHAHVGDGARIAGGSGIFGDVPAGMTVMGYPAMPHKEALRVEILKSRLPEMKKTLDGLERQVEEMRAQIARLSGGEDGGSD